MPDAFFASSKTRKRKRSTSTEQGPSTSKKAARTTAAGKSAGFVKGGKKRAAQLPPKRKAVDEELSDETQDEDEGAGVDEMDLRAPDVDPNAYESGEEDEEETEAEKRLRLAKLYIQEVKEGLSLADGEFDAAEIDRELISARLKQDVMEHSGKVYLFVADSYDLSNPPTLCTRGHRFSTTFAVASEDTRWLYTSGKDGCIIKWDLHTGRKVHTFFKVRLSGEKGKGKAKAKTTIPDEVHGHTDEVWSLALSPDGRYLASGGKDKRVGVWDVEKNAWLKGFKGHQKAISALVFRKMGSAVQNTTTPLQLYTGSFDRNINIYDLSVMGFVETMFGHETPVMAMDTLMRETALSAGGRDKSLRYWKVQESTHLVFRAGGRSRWEDILDGAEPDDMDVDGGERKKKAGKRQEQFVEGSVECVAMVDEMTFLSGGDSGSICLWTTARKKAVFKQPLTHGFDESQVETEGMDVVRKPRWVTALGCLRYSDLFASGSWDGEIRLWKLDDKLKSFSLIGSIPALGVINSLQFVLCPRGSVVSAQWARSEASASVETNGAPQTNDHSPEGAPAKAKARIAPGAGQTALLVAGVGQEQRFGRWIERKGESHLNGALVVALHPRTNVSSSKS